ncbi:MAG: hypothetical protein OEY50_01620 [Nitrospinota bacterium]|nr:hypothetical protein [Nitrospinota bacterium]
MAFLSGCATTEVDKAFRGDMDSFKEAMVIVDYCQSCHVHRTFNPSTHLVQKPAQYEKPPFSDASDCKTCHEIKRNIWRDVIKVTHFPDGSIVESSN